ncbi:MAG: nitroreductase family protein [Rikenellaceae bacterium]
MKKLFLMLTSLFAAGAITTSCCSNDTTSRCKSDSASCCNSDTATMGATPSVSTQEAVLNNIMTRSSVRSYTSQAVEKEKIETLLRAGMAAPTGSNKQPWEFVVITDPAILSQLPSVAGGMRMAANAPLAIAVLGDSRISGSWILDCSAATENILLAAHAMGLGAVWCGVEPNNDTDRVAKMAELLDLPEGVHALNAIIIGYPDSEAQVKDKWKPEKVHYDSYKK